ncbi:MAG: hypothetical protein KF768_13490 [Phycisphaeraceae bacterium]|nr:hypothetical protein [Phycisphaeraceae bacterium]
MRDDARQPAGSLQSASNDFAAAVAADWEDAGRELVGQLTGEQREIVQRAVDDLALLTFDALSNPSRRYLIAAEQAFVISTLTSESGIAALRVERAIVDSIRGTLLRAIAVAFAAA